MFLACALSFGVSVVLLIVLGGISTVVKKNYKILNAIVIFLFCVWPTCFVAVTAWDIIAENKSVGDAKQVVSVQNYNDHDYGLNKRDHLYFDEQTDEWFVIQIDDAYNTHKPGRKILKEEELNTRLSLIVEAPVTERDVILLPADNVLVVMTKSANEQGGDLPKCFSRG